MLSFRGRSTSPRRTGIRSSPSIGSPGASARPAAALKVGKKSIERATPEQTRPGSIAAGQWAMQGTR